MLLIKILPLLLASTEYRLDVIRVELLVLVVSLFLVGVRLVGALLAPVKPPVLPVQREREHANGDAPSPLRRAKEIQDTMQEADEVIPTIL